MISKEDLEEAISRRTEILDDPFFEDQNEQEPMRRRSNISTVICNHVGFIECIGLVLSPLHPGFTPKIELKSVPLISSLAYGLQSIFIDRVGTE